RLEGWSHTARVAGPQWQIESVTTDHLFFIEMVAKWAIVQRAARGPPEVPMSSTQPVGNDQAFPGVVGVDVVIRRRERMPLINGPNLKRVRDIAARARGPELLHDPGSVRFVHSRDPEKGATGLADHHREPHALHAQVPIRADADGCARR